jgi:polyribonucleotide nucleotidyltransferase
MKFGMKFEGEDFEVQINEVAIHADGATLLRYGDTVVLSTVVSSKKNVAGIDFLPLTVEFREKSYAVGEIPGGFFKREGKPNEREILSSRLIDRSVRPLFAPGYVEDTQVISYALSADKEHEPDIAAINATAIALLISDIPFFIPVAAVKVGMKDGKFIINPKQEEEKQELELVVAGTETGIVMVEGRANFIPEEKFIDAIYFAHKHIRKLIDFQKKIVQIFGKPKREYKPITYSEEVIEKIANKIDVKDIVLEPSKYQRRLKEQTTLDELKKELDYFVPPSDRFSDEERFSILSQSFFELQRRFIRKMILEKKKRIDGRGPDDIREIEIKLGVLPRVHGSAIFRRGETQALVSATLGTPRDVQLVEYFGVEGEKKRFMLHYNFPPFSSGEVKPIKGPSRREIGHGYLAEKALAPLIPPEDKFPYTIRIVSDILSSNGSTSMASVCGGSLALFDAGVPVPFHVAGVAMGVIKEGEEYEVITDILGDEDHIGDMDFKLAGSREGISAVQMDLKTFGLSFEIIKDAVMRAKKAREKILDIMYNEISSPKHLSVYAPRFSKLKIDTDKIAALIGPGGRNIKQIVDITNADIEIEQDGTVKIFAQDEQGLNRAIELINYYTSDIEEGKTYKAKVKRILPNGALVQLLPSNQYAFMHISQVDTRRISRVVDSIKPNEEIEVKVIKIEEDGRILVSRREAIIEAQGAQKNAATKKGKRF